MQSFISLMSTTYICVWERVASSLLMVRVWIINEFIDIARYRMSQMKPVGESVACNYTLYDWKTSSEKERAGLVRTM